MSKRKRALDIVNDLRSLANSIEGFISVFAGHEVEALKPESKSDEAVEPKETQHTLEEVRARLAALSQSGKQAQVKKLITDFGAKKLSDIPKEKYPEFLEKMEAL